MFSVAFSATGNVGLHNFWSFTLSHWKPEKIYLVGKEDFGLRVYVPFRDAELHETYETVPGRKVLLSPKLARYVPGETSLYDFQHPENCVYLFGPDHFHLSEDDLGNATIDHSVYIPTDTSDEIYSFVAAAVVLAHRRGQHG